MCAKARLKSEKLKELRIPLADRASIRFMKLDVKDFYMSGFFSVLVDGIFEHEASPELAEAYETCLHSILNNQVVWDTLGNNLHRVCVGAGMGQIISGFCLIGSSRISERFLALRRSKRKNAMASTSISVTETTSRSSLAGPLSSLEPLVLSTL